jgi:hypothetical protein
MTLNYGTERAVAYFAALSKHVSGGAIESHEKVTKITSLSGFVSIYLFLVYFKTLF